MPRKQKYTVKAGIDGGLGKFLSFQPDNWREWPTVLFKSKVKNRVRIKAKLSKPSKSLKIKKK